MSDPNGLEERLRAALGDRDPLTRGGADPGAGRDAARTRVLAGLRRRRLRRLQVTGGAVVVALGLALALPQVLGSSSPSTASTQAASQPKSVHSTGSASAASLGPEHGTLHHKETASPTAAVPTKLVGVCHIGDGTADDGTADDCGALVTGSAARTLRAAASGTENSFAFTSSRSATGFGSPLDVRAGTQVVIDLPRVAVDWRWQTPSIAGAPVSHGSGPPVTVSATSSAGATQQFLVTTKVPVTVLLESEDDVFTGNAGKPGRQGTPAVWVLELKVEET